MEFLEVSEPITEQELASVEKEFKILFTKDFKQHYLKYNGGYPAKSYFQWPDGAKTNINHFFSVKYKGFSQFEQAYTDLFILEQILPVGYIPFACDDGGDLFCVSILPHNYNFIYHCDMHHYNSINMDYFTLIASSFNEFIAGLVE